MANLDSRDLLTRIEELVDMGDDIDAEDKEELDNLNQFKAETEDYAGDSWEDGVFFIDEDDFEDYARELAEDIGAISNDASWPNTCIDWEQAARELQMDYSAADYDGTTYLYR